MKQFLNQFQKSLKCHFWNCLSAPVFDLSHRNMPNPNRRYKVPNLIWPKYFLILYHDEQLRIFSLMFLEFLFYWFILMFLSFRVYQNASKLLWPFIDTVISVSATLSTCQNALFMSHNLWINPLCKCSTPLAIECAIFIHNSGVSVFSTK